MAAHALERVFVPSQPIHDDGERRAALIKDVAKFLSVWLSIRHSCSIETHTQRNGTRRVKQLKDGSSLHDLIVSDGNSTFEHLFFRGEQRVLSLDQRRCVELERAALSEQICDLKGYCEDYRCLLDALEHLCQKQEYIDLAIAVDGDQGYFVPQFVAQLADRPVFVGGFAHKLTSALEDRAVEWLGECERTVTARFFASRQAPDDVSRSDAGRSRRVHATLARMIATHASMQDAFEDDLVTRRRSPLNPAAFEELTNWIFDDSVRAQCETRREEEIQQLRALRPLCAGVARGVEVSVAHHVYENRRVLLQVLRFVPRVLVDRAGFASAELSFEMLIGIVKEATFETIALTAAQLVAWARLVGKASLFQLDRWLKDAESILRRQILPKMDILPTLACVTPPTPSWVDEAQATASYVTLKACGELPKPTNSVERAYLPIPQAVERLLRLVSLVWELAAHKSTHLGFFASGHVRCSILRQIIPKERVNTDSVNSMVMSWRQLMHVGQNYRNAVTELRNFRGSLIESDLRAACRVLSNWSLDDILTVCFEKSPAFLSNEYKLLDATIFEMQLNSSAHNTSIIRKGLEHACPILFELRHEARVSPHVKSNELVEFLLSIPGVRDWARTTPGAPELVLAHEDVARAGASAVARLRQLSGEHSIVHYGRRPASERGVWKAKRVYSFSGHDLAKTLELH